MELGDIESSGIVSLFRILWKKHFHLVQILGILLLAPTLAMSCGNTPIENAEPYFPVQKEPAETVHLAILAGTLFLDKDGCLRVDENNALVIWPYGYSLKTEGEDIWVIDDKGTKAARVGDNIKLGGSLEDDYVVAYYLGHNLPENCKGPFWLASKIVEE